MANYNSTGVNSDFYSTLVNSSNAYGGNIIFKPNEIDFLQISSLQGVSSAGTNTGFTNIINANSFYSTIFYVQRIYDLTLNKYVYYKLTEINTSPGSLQTTPNHSGNISLSSHEVLATSEIITNI
jgi:hypothetical protein